MNNKKILNLFITYRNYLFAIQERNEFGDIYGDTEEIVQIYENELQKHGIKIFTKNKKLLP